MVAGRAVSLTSLWRMLLGELDGPRAGVARAALASRVSESLRAGEAVTDDEFDSIFPEKIRAMSRVHWTPVRVALRCAQLLARKPGSRVLDVGSGVGKLCTIGALTTRGVFTGVEQYGDLVECARDAATLLGASTASFRQGFFSALDPADYDAFYFFNPFEENGWSRPAHLPRAEPLVRGTFEGGVLEAQQLLAAARPGTRVVTYNGMGGALPAGYSLEQRDRMGCVIELWVKDARVWCAV